MCGSSSFWALLFVVTILTGALLWALWPEGKGFEEATGLQKVEWWTGVKARIVGEAHKVSEKTLSGYEQQQIKVWIQRNSLNEYGDSADTMYAGGTPLFDEASGKTIDKYDYVLKQHPDRPWRK